MKKILIVLLACLGLSSCSVLLDTAPSHDVIYYRYDYPYSSTRYYYYYRTTPPRHHHYRPSPPRHHRHHGDRYQPQRNHKPTSTGRRR